MRTKTADFLFEFICKPVHVVQLRFPVLESPIGITGRDETSDFRKNRSKHIFAGFVSANLECT